MTKKIYISLLCLFLLIPTLWAQKRTVSGYIREKGSREALPSVMVYNPETEAVTFSNSYGFYSLTLPQKDTVTLIFAMGSFAVDTVKTGLLQDVTLHHDMEQTFHLNEVTISAEKLNSQTVQMSSIKLTPAEVKQLPALFGEKDVFKTLILMPGVQSAAEGTSGLYVRGGAADQNMVMLDEAIIYNASHLLGFFSIFNGDAVRSVELIKGGFPARYGGRLSSILDIRMKEGSKEGYHGEGGIGLISSNLMVEGPIVKNKGSFMVSGRRTYFDLLSRPIMALISGGMSAGYFFYDINAKLNWDFGDKDKLYVSGYFGRDKFSMRAKESDYTMQLGLYWQNGTAAVRWNHLFGSKLFSNLSFLFNDYVMDVYNKYNMPSENYKYSMDYFSGIRDYALKYDLSYNLNATHSFLMGAAVTLHHARPNVVAIKDELDSTYKRAYQEFGLETAIYIEDEINIRNRFKLNPGVRLVLFSVAGKSYFMPEPRLNMSYNIRKDLAVKASYALMNQYMMLLSSSAVGLPTDLWVPVTKNIKPQRSQQVALGIVYDWAKPKLSFSVEGYFKKLDKIIAYKAGSSFFDSMESMFDGGIDTEEYTSWEEKIVTGQGWAYGVEFLIRRTAGKFTGWVGYTLSWIEHQFNDLNYGEKFFARYDRRHDISIVLMYSPTKKINLSMSWVFATGNAITLPVSIYQAEGIEDGYNQLYYNNDYYNPYNTAHVESYSKKNGLRMKPYHHLDISAQFIKPHKKGKFESIFEISIYNVYNYKNPLFYYMKDNYRLKQLSIFPIIPSFTYHFKF